MAEKNNSRLLKLFLTAGFLFVLTGIVFLILLMVNKTEGLYVTWLLAVMVFSLALVCVSFFMKKAVLFYIGINLFICFVIAAGAKAAYPAAEIKRLWPVMTVSFGVTLVPVAYMKSGKLRITYVIPSAVLTLLGLFFMLFSFGVIKVPFKTFFSFVWPLIFLAAGLLLIVYYLYSRSNKAKFDDDSSELDSEP